MVSRLSYDAVRLSCDAGQTFLHTLPTFLRALVGATNGVSDLKSTIRHLARVLFMSLHGQLVHEATTLDRPPLPD